MSLYSQALLDLHEELIIDCFAGGGGASSGIEQAFGRMVDVAINHDAAAISLHQANHPQTIHLQSDVFEIDPREVCQDRPVAFAWFSPDCTFHSKARGGKPIRSKERRRRSLAWVVTRWAGTVRPRVIMLENVEEFQDWGPLVGSGGNLRPCKKRRGKTFRKWVGSLRKLGYTVEWRELRACDYGAPTIRKRLFLIARCDGKAIVWPEPTHGPKANLPYRTAAECIDWSIPMLSIFATKEEAATWGKHHGQARPIRPLADNTMKRIARGVKRFVLENPKPFLVSLCHGEGTNGSQRWGRHDRDIDAPHTTVKCSNESAVVAPVVTRAQHGGSNQAANAPIGTVTASRKDQNCVVAPYMVPRYGEREGQNPRVRSVEEPGPVVVPDGNGGSLVAAHLHTANNSRDPLYGADEPANTIVADGARHSVIAANLATYHHEGDGNARGANLDKPIHTIDCANRHALVASFLGQHNGGFAEGNSADGHKADDPLSTIATKGPHQSLVASFMSQGNGGFYEGGGRKVDDPLGTILTESRGHHGLVATHIQRDFGTSTGHKADQPVGTITSEGNGKAGLVASFLQKYYGQGVGQSTNEPAHTIPTVDRFGLVTVEIGGQPFYIADIAMRMLQPKELYLCQGFRPGYIIDRGADGKPLTKSEQVRMVGNSVSPPVAEALAKANCPELIVRSKKRAA